MQLSIRSDRYSPAGTTEPSNHSGVIRHGQTGMIRQMRSGRHDPPAKFVRQNKVGVNPTAKEIAGILLFLVTDYREREFFAVFGNRCFFCGWYSFSRFILRPVRTIYTGRPTKTEASDRF